MHATSSSSGHPGVLTWCSERAEGFRFGPWRGLDRVHPGAEGAVARAAFVRAARREADHLVALLGPDGPRAATVLVEKPMESEHFGLAAAAMHPPVTAGPAEDRPTHLGPLLADTLEAAADLGIDLLVLRVDADDTACLVAAQDAGFFVCEATMAWLADAVPRAARRTDDLRGDIEVSRFEGDVRGVLAADEIEQLGRATEQWQLNHFRADPYLPDAAVDAFYRQWIVNISSGTWCDYLGVARHRGRLVGIQVEVTAREVREATGLELRVGEWMIVVQPGLGAGAHLMAAAGEHRTDSVRYHWWETQVRNLATVRSIERTAMAVPVRTAYTLHAWPRR